MAKKATKTARASRAGKSSSSKSPSKSSARFVAPKASGPGKSSQRLRKSERVINGKPARVPESGSTSRHDLRSAKPAAAQIRDPGPAIKPPRPAKKPRREKQKEPLRPLVPLPPPPVTTDSKPKKNQAGLSVKELDTFRNLLLAKRRELLGDMSSMEREALQSGHGSNLSNLPVHMADMGTDNYEQEFTLGLVEKDRQLLREINHALAKIQDGSYGICEGTGKPINKLRLEIQPWTRFSIEHARALEKNMMVRR